MLRRFVDGLIGGGCRCGGHHAAKGAEALSPYELLTVDFSDRLSSCACGRGGKICPRKYLTLSGYVLGLFLVSHLIVNGFGLRPALFQSVVNSIHTLGLGLPMLEIALIFVPLGVHVTLGLQTLRREKLKFGIKKHHRGTDLRNWLQRASAVVLLIFLAFHLGTISPWIGGRFNPANAFVTVHAAVGNFWGMGPKNLANLLIAQFYLLGIGAAVYHLGNGVATGAEVLGFTSTAQSRKDFWPVCVGAGLALGGIGLLAWYSMALTH